MVHTAPPAPPLFFPGFQAAHRRLNLRGGFDLGLLRGHDPRERPRPRLPELVADTRRLNVGFGRTVVSEKEIPNM